MIVTVASGKGGTGKTTVTVNLAAIAPANRVQVFDCDVEEPNSHLFLKPDTIRSCEITTMVPKVDKEKCTLCGEC
jgi:MinD superfamily P-loop ATPase